MARFIGQGLSERLHQNVVVENRGGAGGNIAAVAVAAAQPDGYTLLVTTTAVAINETLRETKQFSALDLTTVAIAASSPEVLVTSPGNPANNLADLIKAAQSKPVNFGSAGVGSGSHIEAEYFFKILTKAPATHIPFQGGAPAMNAVLGNQIDVWATTLGGGAAAQIAAGKLKGLAVADEQTRQRHPERRRHSPSRVFPITSRPPGSAYSHRPRPIRKSSRQLNAAINATINSPEIGKSSPRSASIRSPARRRKQTACSRPKSKNGARWSRRSASASNSAKQITPEFAAVRPRSKGSRD